MSASTGAALDASETVAGVTLVGTGAGCGKTLHIVGLLRRLYDLGRDPVPFKAVAVVDPVDHTSRDPRPYARAIHHHLVAAGVPYSPDFNPLTVVPERGGSAQLFVRGEPRGPIPLVGPDQIDVGALPGELYAECLAVVQQSLDACRRAAPFVVVEGAGDAGRTGARADLANAVAPVLAGYPVLAVFRPGRSRYPTLGGFRAHLPANVDRLVRGVLVNNPDRAPLPADFAEYVGCAAAVGDVQLPPADGTLHRQRERHRDLAAHVWDSLPWKQWLARGDEPVRSGTR